MGRRLLRLPTRESLPDRHVREGGNMNGHWYFRYTGFDSYENHSPEYQERKVLCAKTEVEAALEAQGIWDGLQGYKSYAGLVYPRNPSLSYEYTSSNSLKPKSPPQPAPKPKRWTCDVTCSVSYPDHHDQLLHFELTSASRAWAEREARESLRQLIEGGAVLQVKSDLSFTLA
jgi:hypothetical protein